MVGRAFSLSGAGQTACPKSDLVSDFREEFVENKGCTDQKPDMMSGFCLLSPDHRHAPKLVPRFNLLQHRLRGDIDYGDVVGKARWLMKSSFSSGESAMPHGRCPPSNDSVTFPAAVSITATLPPRPVVT